eukprot:8527710-Pyramimonas_sp.AAC.2
MASATLTTVRPICVLPSKPTNSGLGVRRLQRCARPRTLVVRAAKGRQVVAPSSVATETDDALKEAGLTALRVAAGVLMIHNGLDKLADPEGFAKFVVEPYLGEFDALVVLATGSTLYTSVLRLGLTFHEVADWAAFWEWALPRKSMCVGLQGGLIKGPLKVLRARTDACVDALDEHLVRTT